MDGAYLPRTCTVSSEAEKERSHALAEFRDRDAYVLLGAPGAGKTRAFEHEARDAGGHYVTVRNFLTFEDRIEWHETTLYIDGLDERRAGSSSVTTPLDAIRKKLDSLGKPRFRLSCREADWFGANDRSHLAMVAPGGEVTELRLDPLTEEDILELLRQLRVDDPRAFVAKARDQGLDALMGNPQALQMLARSVAGGGEWPTTRLETFERSCCELAKELNREHQLAGQPKVGTPELLDAAGRLCTVFLLTGAAGYTEFEGEDLLPLSGFRQPDPKILKAVCRTSLFETNDLSIEPRHRQIAEFLGGRHLAELVAGGLPVGRIMALLTGFDGGIVSELRGLAAWWASHDPEARPAIIERDPLGVVLYGDVREFSVAEKETVIDGLERIADRDPSNLTLFRETDARWGDLATENMATSFGKRLSARDGSEARQAVQIALLESLARGTCIPGVAPLLLDNVRDSERPQVVREMSLGAHLQQNTVKKEQIALLDDIRAGRIRDPNDRLLADLLKHLYPESLSAPHLSTYFSEPKDDSAGWLTSFWLIHVPRVSTDEQLEQLMDALATSDKLRKAAKRPAGVHYLFRNIPSRLIWELLKRNRNDANRLFEWLGFIDPHDYVDEGEQIRGWFGDHPGTFKAVFRISVEREPDPVGLYGVGRLLINWIRPPGDFAMWCVAEANIASDDESSRRFARNAAAHLGTESDWNEVERKLHRRPHLRAVIKQDWEDLQNRRELATQESARYADDQRQRRQRRQKRRHDAVRRHAQALDRNQGSPQLLHDLARAYFGIAWDVEGRCPRERLLDVLDDDLKLVDTVLRAFVGTAERADLPTLGEILRLATEHRSHYISLPFMAGLEERDEPVDEASLRLGLAILSSDAVPVENPGWYTQVVEERPELVAEMLVKSARRAFRASHDDSAGLFRLSSADHAIVADHALLPVLTAFPTRSTSRRLPLLATLLGIGLVRQPRQLTGLARRKLRSNSIDVAQRMYWLCAGLLAGCGEFVALLRAALEEGGERRVRHVASFFREVDGYRLMATLRPNALAMLIRSLSATYRPVRLGPNPQWVTPSIEGGELIRRCIDQLAGIPDPKVGELLELLASDAALEAWSRQLRHARTTQMEARRNATFRHRDMPEVLDTLAGAKPANAADLTAVTVEELAKLATDVRHGNTSDWRLYWTTGAKEPEHEETCRDRLLSHLNRELKRLNVYGEPEGRYADGKRADIKVFGAAAAVPIEIKKSKHPELWTAIRTQLMAKYTRDPLAEGHGIYLVLWFGQTLCHRRRDGRIPESAEQLRNDLQAQLSPEESRKVSVCVFDVSKPA